VSHESSDTAAIQLALDGLLRALELETLGGDRFRAHSERGRFDRIFGGQTLAQALLAAGATVTDKRPDSLHAYFVETGAPGEPVDLAVDRVRDGRSVSVRRVTVAQAGRPLLVLMASFHVNRASPQLAAPPPPAPRPETLPTIQDWARAASPERVPLARSWIERPPPIELRIGEPPRFMGGPAAKETRSHWMRAPQDLGGDPLLHAALLAYASDFFLLDMAYRNHPESAAADTFLGWSLGHALWLHRPVRFDGWHLHSQETLAISGERGLVRGAIHDADGQLVASAIQEVLVRPEVTR
jgi:acyl-CoA thioesterase-2